MQGGMASWCKLWQRGRAAKEEKDWCKETSRGSIWRVEIATKVLCETLPWVQWIHREKRRLQPHDLRELQDPILLVVSQSLQSEPFPRPRDLPWLLRKTILLRTRSWASASSWASLHWKGQPGSQNRQESWIVCWFGRWSTHPRCTCLGDWWPYLWRFQAYKAFACQEIIYENLHNISRVISQQTHKTQHERRSSYIFSFLFRVWIHIEKKIVLCGFLANFRAMICNILVSKIWKEHRKRGSISFARERVSFSEKFSSVPSATLPHILLDSGYSFFFLTKINL